MLKDDTKNLIKSLNKFDYDNNYIKVRFFLIQNNSPYALNYFLHKLSFEQLENYFDVMFKKEFKYRLGAYYGI